MKSWLLKENHLYTATVFEPSVSQRKARFCLRTNKTCFWRVVVSTYSLLVMITLWPLRVATSSPLLIMKTIEK